MKSLKIAIFPQQGLGDGIILLILANNLYKNNFNVTVFHRFIPQINNWFDFELRECPLDSKVEETLKNFDIVLMDCNIPYLESQDEQHKIALSKKYIFFSVGCIKTSFIHDHTEQFIAQLGEQYSIMIEHFSDACRLIDYAKNNSMVDNLVLYCQKTLHLKDVEEHTGINIPTHLQLRKYKNRVIISPTSSVEKKNWSPKKFVLLARLLKRKGYDVTFAVAMNERQEWVEIINNEFPLPVFKMVKDYAQYVYESLAFIGNDSGGGHVASMMGVPVLTIISSSKKMKSRWRPGWGKNRITAPVLTFKYRGTRYWQAFLSVKKVYREFEYLISDN